MTAVLTLESSEPEMFSQELFDFLSFDPRFPADLQTFYVRVERDDDAVAAYAKKAEAFLAEVQAEVESVRGLKALESVA